MNVHSVVIALLVGIALTTACQNKKDNDQEKEQPAEKLMSVPYALDAPTNRFEMPPDLEEISGLSYYKKDQLLCVQDEKAVVYIYDLKKRQVADSSVFGGYGDFEGVEWAKGEMYALKSNGDLYHFKPFSKQIARIPTDLPKKTEVEGLAYDPQTNRLLIAEKEGAKKHEKIIYMYDLDRKVVWQGLTIPHQVLADAHINAGQFKPSALAIHPQTGDLYLLTSVGKRLVVLNKAGKIVASEPLDAKLFRQPEGLCFAPDGTMYIASEGDGKKGYILAFAKQAE